MTAAPCVPEVASRPLGIVVDARDDGLDGIGRYTRQLVGSLPAAVPTGSQVTCLGWGGPPRYTRAEGLRLVALAGEMAADVVHCLDYRVPIPPVPAAVVVSVHDVHRLLHPELCYSDEQFRRTFGHGRLSELAATVTKLRDEQGRAGRHPTSSLHAAFYELMLLVAVRRADVVLVPTAAVRSDLARTCSFDAPVLVVPYGVDHLPPCPEPVPADNTLARTLDGRPLFVYVGQSRPHKRVDAVRHAFRRVAARHPSAQLTLVGAAFAPRGAKVDERVVPCGAVDDTTLAWLLSESAAVVHLASHEGFGFTPLEAMSQGAPAVVSDIPVLRETLGRHARFVRADRPDEVADAMLDAATQDDPAARAARIAHARSFRWQACAAGTAAAYQVAVDRHARRRQPATGGVV